MMQCAIRSSLFAFVLAIVASAASAQSSAVTNLGGWWIAIDETGHKPIWDRGLMVAMEELLIIDVQGRFENRMMGFFSVDHQDCDLHKRCSDAPLVATGRFTLAGAVLSIEDYRATNARLDAPGADEMIRAAAISTTRVWAVHRLDAAEGVLVLRKGSGHETRSFFRIEPNRLRAGLMAAELSALRNWRCFVAAATGAVHPVPGLRPSAALAPPIGDYVKIASYLQTAYVHSRWPTLDDPDPVQRKFAGLAVENLMSERFDSLALPKTTKESRDATLVAIWLRQIAGGETSEAATAVVRRRASEFKPPLDISAGEIAALKLASAETPDAKRLFCKQ
jgi:hypothetical protein